MKQAAGGNNEVINKALETWYDCMLGVLPDPSVNPTVDVWRAAHAKTLRTTFEQDKLQISSQHSSENAKIAYRNLGLFSVVDFKCTLCKDERAYIQFHGEAEDYLNTWCHNGELDCVESATDKEKK